MHKNDFCFRLNRDHSLKACVYYNILNIEFQDGIKISVPLTRISTGGIASMCGVDLEVGQVYILNGEINSKVFEPITEAGWLTTYPSYMYLP